MARDLHQAVRDACLWMPEAEEFLSHGSQGIAWKRVAALVREAYEKVAPAALQARVGKTPPLKAPTKSLSASQIDPMQSPRALRVLKSFRHLCLDLPESREERQFGHPVWQAGRKTFALARHDGRRLTLCFWVGVDKQGLLTTDARYQFPHTWVTTAGSRSMSARTATGTRLRR